MLTDTPPGAGLLHDASPAQRSVMAALALGATYRSVTWIALMMGLLGEHAGGRRMTTERVREVLQELAAARLVTEHPNRGAWKLSPSTDNAVLLRLRGRPDFGSLAGLLAKQDQVDKPYSRFGSKEEAAALVRLELLAGRPVAEVQARWQPSFPFGHSQEILRMAQANLGHAALIRHLHSDVQIHLVRQGLVYLLDTWEPATLPLAELATDLLGTAVAAKDVELRLLLIEYRLCSGHLDDIEALLAPLREASGEHAARHRALAQSVQAAVQAHQGRWAEAQASYEAALAVLRKPPGPRKGALPAGLMLPYLQCLLARQTPECLDKALKLCATEAGQRQPTPGSPWGVASLAIQMRRGDIPRDSTALVIWHWGVHALRTDLWKWLMRAWLKDGDSAQDLSDAEKKLADLLLARLQAAGLGALYAQLEDALNVLAARPTRTTFFVPPAQESWRAALAALAALGDGGAAPTARAGKRTECRLVWVLEIDEDGLLLDIVPQEQKLSARGWSRPQQMPLWKLAKAANLAPHDLKVVRCIRRLPHGSAREMMIDGATALQALIGHPAVEFSDRPGVAVTLEAGAPQLEVADTGDSLRLTLDTPLREPDDESYSDYDDYEVEPDGVRDSAELANTTVVRDGTQRARVVTFTPAQRRAALLLGAGLTVPKAAQAQLQAALQGLGVHFQVHADSPPDAMDVPAQSELRAELTPLGDGLRLRLVAAPLGPEGPRTVPGHGRSRMIATVQGQTLAAQRDLSAERRHLAAVLEACPVLGGAGNGMGDDSTEFDVADAEDALALLEVLPRVAGVQALDWPAGRPVSVAPVGLEHLRVRTQAQGERPWFALAGGVQIDEAQVYALEQLMQWSRGSRGRFVPLGNGRYLALTQELRGRITDLAAVAEVHGGEARVPSAAALWLGAALEGTDWQADGGLQRRLDRLAAAHGLAPALPSTLQAELRPYQLEGYQWAQRLATAGWGACLADDMGLGKTLQALAVLLARAAEGPALVVAPTSLMGNWLVEARRFAPSLRVVAYGGEGSDRDDRLASAAAHDVVLVSYALLQLNAEAFAARSWHTLVLDEAQALKNAAAKRTQAVQTIKAEFRLALSGTPIENRLAELWSIMHICNPGLLGSLARFNERFATPIERDRDRDAQRTLRRLVAPFVLRRTKSQVLDDLPPRTELTLALQPEAAERAHYEVLRRQALAAAETSLAEGGGQAQLNVLAQLTRLRRAACDPRLVSRDWGQPGAKVQAFGELAAELAANGHKALVFSQFVDFLALLREPLEATGITYQYLDGATPAAERTRRVAAFQAGEGALFLISLKAGGFGLNLTVADYVVIADPWWNPAAEDQASGRAHRMGQQRPVTVYRLVNAGTLEERIVELHQHKRALADGVLEGAESAGALDAAALMELMRG